MDLFDFFYTLNQTPNNKDIKEICKHLVSTRSSLTDIISIFDANKGFENILRKDESELIRYCMQQIDGKSDTYCNYINRDETMYGHITFMVDNLLKVDENVTLFCHLGHVCSGHQIPEAGGMVSLGYLLRQRYGDDYSCVGLATDKGRFLTSESQSYFSIEEIKPAPVGSMEWMLSKMDMDECYVSMDKVSCSDISQIRYMGNRMRDKQFVYLIPKGTMDGIIFLKYSVPIYKKEDAMKNNLNLNLSIMNQYQRALEMIKK